jgi:hypothetical protein
LEDVLVADLADRYKLIIVSYNTFMHFSAQADQFALLQRLHGWLEDDGLLVLDLPNAGAAFATQDDSAVVLERVFVEPESGDTVMQHSVSALDRVTQQMEITWIYDAIGADGVVRRTLAPLLLRYVFAAEMDLLLKGAGLRRVQTYGDYLCGPFVDGCERMIVLARKHDRAAESGA